MSCKIQLLERKKKPSEMFPSTNNGNVDPINFQRPPFFPDNSQQHLQLDQSIFNLPYDDFFHCQNGGVLPPLEHQTSMISESEKNKSTKRPKKDRHSKINTAQGPRGRRMRLSLKVAREFFGLQDKLGFDRPSKTVEWLLIQARSATGISPVNQSASPASECEVISANSEEDEEAVKDTPKEAKTPPSNKGKRAKPSRKNAFNPQAKEMREKAKAKARERTREKQLNKKIEMEKAYQINQLSCWSSDVNENGEDSVAQTHLINPTNSQLTTPESISEEAIENWSPFAIFSHFYHPGFPQGQNEITDFPTMWE